MDWKLKIRRRLENHFAQFNMDESRRRQLIEAELTEIVDATEAGRPFNQPAPEPAKPKPAPDFEETETKVHGL